MTHRENELINRQLKEGRRAEYPLTPQEAYLPASHISNRNPEVHAILQPPVVILTQKQYDELKMAEKEANERLKKSEDNYLNLHRQLGVMLATLANTGIDVKGLGFLKDTYTDKQDIRVRWIPGGNTVAAHIIFEKHEK